MKRALLLFLAFILVLTAAGPITAGAATVTRVIANDLLMQFPEGVGAVSIEFVTYVPIDVFAQNFNFTYSYDSIDQVLTVSNGGKSLYFNRKLGLAMDNDRKYYSYISYVSGGYIMVPVLFVCNYFGLRYTYLSAGPAIRITNGFQRLTNEEALLKYDAVFHPAPNGSEQPPPPPVGQQYNKQVYLTFSELGSSEDEAILHVLSQYKFNAAFFLTGEEIESHTELVYQIAARGYTIGIKAGQTEGEARWSREALLDEVSKTNDILSRLIKQRSGIVLLPASRSLDVSKEARDALSAAGYRLWNETSQSAQTGGETIPHQTLNANAVKWVSNRKSPAVVRFSMGEETLKCLEYFLAFLRIGGYSDSAITFQQSPINLWGDIR